MPRWIPLIALLAAVPAAAQSPAPEPADTLATACRGDAFRQFDFWVGHWNVSTQARGTVGQNRIDRVAAGCGLREVYHAGGYNGTSLNWYDPGSGEWTQIWIDNSGLRLHLTGGVDDRGAMVLSGERVGRDGPVTDRITWVPQPDGSVRQIWDVSSDGGLTWRNVFSGHYTRVEGY